ncbi:MAG TPA: GNAT family N-acetyltransferase [Polyangia bacterium]|nr:GNAT family N-acetyltransferase [Polyangia bacterium]
MDAPRACLAPELPRLIEAANQVFRPSGGDMGTDYPLLFSLENLRHLRVASDRGALIAHAGLCVRTVSWQGTPRPVGAIGAVFTRADRRGQGWGAAVVSDALACARAEGVPLVVVSGDGPLYRRLGFAPAPPAVCWTWPAGAGSGAGLRGLPDPIQVRPCRQSDLPQLARWYDQESVHFQRDTADWRAFLGAQVVFAWPACFWVVEDHAGPAGYLVVAQGTRRRVLELAGDRDAVLAAAPSVSDQLVVPDHDTETARAAAARGWSPAPLTLAMAGQWLQAPARPLPLPWYGLNYV